MARGIPWLVFPRALEDRFIADNYRKRLSMIGVVNLAAVWLFGCFLVVDWLMTPDVVAIAAAVRLLVFPLVMLGGYHVLCRLGMGRLNEWMVAAAGLAAVALDCIVLLSSQMPWMILRTVELNLVIVFTCALARFWPAVALCVGSAVMYLGLLMHLPDPSGVLRLNMGLLFGAVTVFTLFASYRLELDERLGFLARLREAQLDRALQLEHDRLASLATTDALTGVANRRSFEDYLAGSWARAQSEGLNLSLLMIDVDHFKRYNDHFGHQAGDRCLVAVTRAIESCLRRPVDLVARVGGEEFAVVMVDADIDAARAAAERVRQAVQALQLPHPASGSGACVSVSIGVSGTRPGADLAVGNLVARADAALYRAKSEGRNRVAASQEGQGLRNPLDTRRGGALAT